MADAMREKYAGDAQFQCRLARQLGETDPLHEVAQDAVRGQVHLPIIAPRDDFIAEQPLCAVQGLDQFGIAARQGGIRAGDIRGITAVLSAGVDQERAQGLGGRTLQVLVMQHRAVLVVGHDVVVRHLLFTLCAGLQVAHVGFVFGPPAAESSQRRPMAASTELVGAAHAF